MKKLTLFISAFLLLSFGACQKQTTETFPPVRYLYAGSQGDNKFQLWIWVFEDETVPALVRSGMCRYLDNQFIDTDEEHLACQLSEGGFTLSDPATGRVLYTATNVEKEGCSPGFIVHIAWNHSPGATWDSYAEEKGWMREMNLQVQRDEGDDIVY